MTEDDGSHREQDQPPPAGRPAPDGWLTPVGRPREPVGGAAGMALPGIPGSAPPAAAMNLKAAVLALFLLFSALGIGWTALSIHADLRHIVAETETEAVKSARLLEEHALRTFENSGHVLHRVEDLVAATGLDSLASSEDAWLELRSLTNNLPPGSTLWIFDRDGLVVLGTPQFPAPTLSVSDRAYFAALRDQELYSHIGSTIKGRTTGRLVFTYSRRLTDAKGRFAGVVQASIDAHHFSNFYQTLNPAPRSVLAIFRSDGALVAHHGLAEEDIGRSFDDSSLFRQHLTAGPSGLYRGKAPLADQDEHIVAFRRVKDLPLVVVAALDYDQMLASWRHRAYDTGGLLLAALGVLGGLTLVAVRRIGRETKARTTLFLTNKLLEQSYQQLQDAHAVLENRVAERTHELSEVNRRLVQGIEERRGVQARLIASDRFSRAILDSISSHVAILDEQGDIQETNRAWTGFAAENGLPGRHDCIGANYLVVCDQAARGGDKEAAAAADGIRAVLSGLRREFVLDYGCHSKTDQRWFNLRVTRLRGEGPPRLVVSHEPITNIKVVEEALLQAKKDLTTARDRAEAASKAKSEFLATMSHELRTPLNAIIGTVESLGETALDPDQRQHVEALDDAAGTLLDLVDQTLDLSRLEQGRIELERRPFNVADLVSRTCDTLAARARRKDLNLVCQGGDTLPTRLAGDPFRLRQILIHLIGNAIKFTERGGITVTAAPACGGSDNGTTVTLTFTIADTGIGIAPDLQHHIFDRFTQADSSMTRRYGGSGLGLAVARELAKAMGGDIGVVSRVGEGSTFRVILPFARIGDEAAEATPEPAPISGDLTPLPPLRILLVEDSEYNRFLIQTYLKGLAETLDWAEDGERAVAAYQAGRYDLVLMDVQMPVMDGYAATRAIRAFERETGRSATPIIALTAHAFASDVKAALAAGCNAHLSKPVRKGDLLTAIRHHTRTPSEQAAYAPPSLKDDSGPIVDAPPSSEDDSGPILVRIDPDLRPIFPRYFDMLRQHVDALRDALGRGDIETVRLYAHRMKGEGGAYGLDTVSELGAAIEQAVLNGDHGALGGHATHLARYLSRVTWESA